MDNTNRETDLAYAIARLLDVMRYYHKDYTNVGDADVCECPECCGHCKATKAAREALAKAGFTAVQPPGMPLILVDIRKA